MPAASRDTAARKLFSLGSRNSRFGGRAGRDYAHDFAADEFFAGAGFLHLIADGYAVPGADQPRDVAFRGVIGNAAHRDRLALFAIARGQSDLQQARGHLRVVVEKLVEIAQAEKQQRLRMLLLDGVILPQQRRSGWQS